MLIERVSLWTTTFLFFGRDVLAVQKEIFFGMTVIKAMWNVEVTFKPEGDRNYSFLRAIKYYV